jgi:hypothetical protein
MMKVKTATPHIGVHQTQKRINTLAMFSGLVIALFLLCIGQKAVAKGLLLGNLFSIINFFLMGKSIPMTLGRSRHMAGLVGLASILLRFVLLSVPMVVGIKVPSFDFAGVVVGIFWVQIVTLFEYLLIRPILGAR